MNIKKTFWVCTLGVLSINANAQNTEETNNESLVFPIASVFTQYRMNGVDKILYVQNPEVFGIEEGTNHYTIEAINTDTIKETRFNGGPAIEAKYSVNIDFNTPYTQTGKLFLEPTSYRVIGTQSHNDDSIGFFKDFKQIPKQGVIGDEGLLYSGHYALKTTPEEPFGKVATRWRLNKASDPKNAILCRYNIVTWVYFTGEKKWFTCHTINQKGDILHTKLIDSHINPNEPVITFSSK